ncbi:hypothetical protein K438DRAFT_1981571 [Mycena galopus ATCC 62051]|nr:hypothetical protein K438DRAFT_1981571 [Mycena galopus ATCC 62051]
MSDSKEHVTGSLDDRLSDLVQGILILGIVLSAMVLMAFGCTASQRRSRLHLHRVSFRLLVYALVSNFIFAVTLVPMEMFTGGLIPAAACTFIAFAGKASLLFSACMYFCMALNLQLVLIHGVNGLMMEKYYVMGSSLLVGITAIIPLAAGQFESLDNDLCWFSNPNPVLKFRWLVGTQEFWILFMASSELVCFVILVSYMLRLRMSVKRMRSDISAEMTALQQAAYSAAPMLQFRRIILRIALYPFLSSILNFSGASLDLYLAAKPLANTELNFRLNAVGRCIFNARPLLYALLAATDPSFIRAIGALRNLHPSASSDGSQRSSSTPKSQSRSSRSMTPSLFTRTLADGNKAESNSTASMVRLPLEVPGPPQQTEADSLHAHMHRDPEEGIGGHFKVVEDRKNSIEFQI